MTRGLACLLATAAIVAASRSADCAESKPAPTHLPPVEVVETTPLPGVGLARDRIPAPVQSGTSADIERSLDRQYYTAAVLRPTGFIADGSFIARPLPPIGGEFPIRHATFYAPGAPRTFWIGLRYQFDAPSRVK
jgi:hypothetical protein